MDRSPRTPQDLRPLAEPAPRWWAEVARAVAYGIAGAALLSAVFLFSLTGWLRYRSTTDATVDADAPWAAILAVLLGFLWPFLLLSTSRDDLGYPRRGLAGILPPALLAVCAIDVVTVALWSLLMDGRAPAGSVLLTVTSDPISLLTVGAVLVTAHAWCTAGVLGFVRPSELRVLVSILGWLVASGLCFWFAVRTFEGAPSAIGLVGWVGAAVLGLVVLTLLALVDELWGTSPTRVWR